MTATKTEHHGPRVVLADDHTLLLGALEKLLTQRGVGLTVSDAAKNRIVELGYDPAYGARPLKRVILRELQDPLADALLRGRFPSGSVVEVDFVNERFSFEARV